MIRIVNTTHNWLLRPKLVSINTYLLIMIKQQLHCAVTCEGFANLNRDRYMEQVDDRKVVPFPKHF